jgi:hypothetical protein
VEGNPTICTNYLSLRNEARAFHEPISLQISTEAIQYGNLRRTGNYYMLSHDNNTHSRQTPRLALVSFIGSLGALSFGVGLIYRPGVSPDLAVRQWMVGFHTGITLL